MKRISGIFCIVAALSLCANVYASGFVVPLPESDSVRPHRPPHHQFGPLELAQHHLQVSIVDQVATTRIEQVFRNTSSRVIEGMYMLPIPESAQIDRFTMFINGTETEAELLPAEQAKKIYEDIVRTMKDPALLEYVGRDLLRVRIFPIQPRDDVRVRLTYTELLRRDAGMISYRQPLPAAQHGAKTIGEFSARIDIASDRRLTTIYSPTHSIDVTRRDGGATIGLEADNVTATGDFELLFALAADDAGIDASMVAFRRKAGEPGYFLMLLSPNEQVDDAEIVSKDVVFVLDTSGSMARGKLAQAKAALQYCLASLNEDDRFEIIEFATEARPLFGALKPVDDQSRKEAAEFVDALAARGGTAIDAALRNAVSHVDAREQSDRPYVVIFLTDGQATVGERRAEQILANVSSEMSATGVRIFCFGIGSDVNTRLLDTIALDTRAVSQYVLADEDIEVKVSDFYAKINNPVLADVKLTFGEGVRVRDLYPSPLPDLFKGDQLALLGRYDGHAAVTVELSGSVNGTDQSIVHEVNFPETAVEHEFVPRLWATRRVGFLLDQMRLHGQSEELRDEVVLLAREYGIVTPYTSYLIIEDEGRRNVPLALRSQNAIEAAGAPAREAARESFDQFANAVTGDSAVGSAQSNSSLRVASQLQDITEADSVSRRVGSAVPMQQSRFVRGRAFYQNGEQWIDSNVQAASDAKRVRIQFDSDEYYALLREHPHAAPWLSVGRNVQVLLGDVVYDIHDEQES